MRRSSLNSLRARMIFLSLVIALPAVALVVTIDPVQSLSLRIAALACAILWAALSAWLGARFIVSRPIESVLNSARPIGGDNATERPVSAQIPRELEPIKHRLLEMGDALRRQREESDRTARSLRDAEEALRPHFAGNPHPMLICEPSTHAILAANEAAMRYYGFDQGEMIGKSMANFHPPEEAAEAGRRLAAAEAPLASCGPWRHRRKDGTWRDVEISSCPLTFAGRPARLISILDITDRRRAETERDALQQIARRLCGPLEVREVGQVFASESRRLFRHDAFLFTLMDGPTQSFQGVYAEEMPPGAAEPAEAPLDPARSCSAIPPDSPALAGKPVLIDRAEDPAPSPAFPLGLVARRSRSLMFAPVLWEGRPIGVLSVQSNTPGRYGGEDLRILDVFAAECSRTLARLRAEGAVRESTQRLRTLTESASIGIWHVGPEGRTIYVNPTMCALLEIDSETELAGIPYQSFFGLESQARLAQEESNQHEGLRSPFEVEIVGKRGRRCTVMASIAPLAAGVGRPEGFLGTFIDVTDRKEAQEQSRRQLERLSALRMIDMTITASMDLRLTLHTLLDQAIHQLRTDAADILRLNPQTQMLNYAAGRGFRSTAVLPTPLRLGEGIAGRAALDRRIICIPDLSQSSGYAALPPCRSGEEFISYIAIPLIARGLVKGILEIYHRRPFNPDREWLDFLDAVASQAAIAIDNATLFKDLQRSSAELGVAYDSTLEGWSHALDLRDRETVGHSQRVTDVTLRLTRTINLNDADLIHIRRGALLHDIGKMGIPDNILHKPGPLTEEEWEIMKRHPVYAYKMLWPIAYLRPALDIPYCHHEKWDGSGYPRGLKGEEIPLAARIFAVVDVWDALSSDRPYRKAWASEKVREHIRSLAGTHFDPKVTALFLDLDLSRMVRETVEANEAGTIQSTSG